jgi:hypothetical protein
MIGTAKDPSPAAFDKGRVRAENDAFDRETTGAQYKVRGPDGS